MALIQVQSLAKYYGDFAAIEDVSFSINDGEIIGLLGLNGAGKSTILKILGTFLLPSAGEARIDQQCVEEESDSVRRMIGYLPDKPPLYPEMKVVPYLKYVALLKGVAPADVDRLVLSAVKKTNLEGVMWQPLSELSHGYQQRVGIAQALVHNPKVLILDEPINGLDPVQIVEMRDLILSLRGKHTVILSSHILSEITRTCDRILIIDRGRLVAQGTQADLESGVTASSRVILETKDSPDLTTQLQKINGVAHVAMQAKPLGVSRYVVDVTLDARPEIARLVVQAGHTLLTLQKEDQGLENLFMKLVKSSKNQSTGNMQ